MDLPRDPRALLDLLRYRLLGGMRRVALGGYTGPGFRLEDRDVVPLQDAAAADVAIADTRAKDTAAAGEVLQQALNSTHADGAVYLVVPGGQAAAWRTLVSGQGLLIYCGWCLHPAGGFTYFPASPPPLDDIAAAVLMLVRGDYDPIAHARRLLGAGRMAHAYELLSNVPDALVQGDEARGLLAAEKQLCLYAWDKHLGDEERLNRFATAHFAFYEATTHSPFRSAPYQIAALFWQRVGRHDMARRQLRSLLQVQPDSAAQQMLDGMPALESVSVHAAAAPAWSGRPMRILYLMHPNSDYGADMIYDGLCRLLGPEQVTEYPYKATLHGGDPALAAGYPCVFAWPGKVQDAEAIVARAGAGAFDVILCSDTLHMLPREETQAILAAAAATPLFITDTWDQCGDYREAIEAHLGRASAGQFKREMLAGARYTEGTWPLTFGYPDGLVPQHIDYTAKSGLFWAGKDLFGARRLSLAYLRERRGMPLNASYAPDEYAKRIDAALAGLCLFGNGFDTVRFWELPAHGALLVAERPPILMTHPFTDGENALLFEDLGELGEKLAWLDAHEDAARAMAERGHAHFLAHHTGTARARELLGRVEAALARH